MGWKDVERISKPCFAFLRISKLRWLATSALRKTWKSVTMNYNWRSAVIINWRHTSHDLSKITYIMEKDTNYELIFVNINWLIKIVNYKQVQTTIDIPKQPEIISDIVISCHNPSRSVTKTLSLPSSSIFVCCYCLSTK